MLSQQCVRYHGYLLSAKQRENVKVHSLLYEREREKERERKRKRKRERKIKLNSAIRNK